MKLSAKKLAKESATAQNAFSQMTDPNGIMIKMWKPTEVAGTEANRIACFKNINSGAVWAFVVNAEGKAVLLLKSEMSTEPQLIAACKQIISINF